MGQQLVHRPVEAVHFLVGVLDQGPVQGQFQEVLGCLLDAAGGGGEGGVRGGREGDIEQYLVACVRVVPGDHVDRQPRAEPVAQPAGGPVGGLGLHEGHQTGGVAVGGERQHAGGAEQGRRGQGRVSMISRA